MKLRAVVSALILAAGLSACSMFPLGPDLTTAPSPFGDAPVVHFIGDGGEVTEIRHGATGDTAVLDFNETGKKGKSYEAGITWLPISNPGDKAHDYWLAGVNIFRSADRSAYLLIRYPHGTAIARPMKSDTFETIVFTCQMRGVNPFGMPSEDTTSSDGSASSASSSSDSADKVCDFTDRADLDAFVPQVLKKAADPSTAEDDDSYKWQPVTIELP